MAKKNIFENMQFDNKSYLLDPSINPMAESINEKVVDTETAQITSVDQEVSLDDLEAFKNHPFSVDTDCEEFEQLVDSIRNNGVINPILVRPIDGGKYEIIAGHRRTAACRVAGIERIPVIIRNLNDYEATILMVHSNFHREKIQISEKAKAYRMCLDAEKHQGVKGADTAAMLGKDENISRKTVYRFIRLSYLNQYFLDLLDIGKLQLGVGVELSYLKENEQADLENVMDSYGIVPNIVQAELLREKSKNDSCSYEFIVATLVTTLKKKAANSLSFKSKDLKEYFDEGTDTDTMHDIIIKLLEKYRDGELDQFM